MCFTCNGDGIGWGNWVLRMGLVEWGWDWLRELSRCLLPLLGGKDEPLISLFGIIFCIPLLSPLWLLMLLTFLNDLLINLFLFITKPIHNDKLQSLVFFKEYNLFISSSNESFKKNTNSPVSAPHSIRGIFTPL